MARKIWLFILILATATASLRADVSEEEKKQRAIEEERVRKSRDRESIHRIPDLYRSLKRPFLIKEGPSEINSNSVVYRLGNPSKIAIYFRGYEPAFPIRKYQERRNGVWTDLSGGYCGTGLGIRSLKPGESVLLEAIETKKRRFGVDLLSDSHGTSLATTLWSE